MSERKHNHTKESDAVASGGWEVHKGHTDDWELISKASNKSLGIMKSTKRMRVSNGYLWQVSTETPYGVAEALVFQPCAHEEAKP